MNKERLLKLADYLETNADSISIHMEHWGKETECGTVLCVGGHACNIPEFREAGLRLVWEDGLAQIWFNDHWGMDAVEEFFGIDSADAYEIFHPNSYFYASEFDDEDEDDHVRDDRVDVDDVIANIHAVIEENESNETEEATHD